MKKSKSLWLVPALIAAGATGYLTAGPLTPPPGPVASTHKTLTEIEPRIAINSVNTPGDADSLYKIDKPGSYYLTSNVTAVLNKHGIEIAASDVTLDLNGFTVAGFGVASGPYDGITTVNLARSGITVCNGHVTAWGNSGIDLQGTSHIIENVTALANMDHGILVQESGSVVSCTARSNVTGIEAGAGSSITSCTVSANNLAGISAGVGSQVSHCTSHNNAGTGIVGSSRSLVIGCNAVGNNVGIYAHPGSSVLDCFTGENDTDGIQLGSDCIARGNKCEFNGSTGNAAGIYAESGCRIEANDCTNADRGIEVTGPGNIIIKNSCSGNTVNWSIVAGNSFLVVKAPVTASNFTGDAGGGGYGSTDPNANFTY